MPTPRADEPDAVMVDGIDMDMEKDDEARLHPLCDFEFTFESSTLLIEPDVRSHLDAHREAFALT